MSFRSLIAACILSLYAMTALPFAATAQQPKGGAIVSDAEIEGLLADYTAPLFRAAGLGNGAVDIFLINDDRFNAFVSGRRMFVNTGAIKLAKTPNEIIGVLAHEIGHVVGGHQIRMRDRIEKANVLSVIALLAGAGAMATGTTGGDAVGQALAFGGRSAILRDLLAYKRTEESAADATAIKLLAATKQSAKGLLATLDRFNKDILFQSSRIDPYMQTHPLPRERISMVGTLARNSPYFDMDDPAGLQLRHDLARAKIAAYTGNTGEIQAMFRDNPQGLPVRYGMAITLYLRGDIREALPMLDRLAGEMPKNPYLHEMRGEMLLKAGRGRDAAQSLQKALALDGRKSSDIRISYAHALLESRDPKVIDKAIGELKNALSRDPAIPRGYGLLARAYAASGDEHRARAAAAEEAFYSLRLKEAKRLATLAQSKLKNGSPDWLRMQDIIDYKPPKKS